MRTFETNVIGILLAIILTGGSYFVGLYMGWIETVSWLEAFAVFTSYACTYLCVVQSRTNYYWGVVSVAAYSLLFWQSELFASMVLNIYLVPTLIWGWYRWRPDSDTRTVQFVEMRWWPVYLGLAGAVWLGMTNISTYYGGTLTNADSFILAGSILAQFLLDQKKVENWAVWAVINLVAIKVYTDAGLMIVAFQYVFFLANTLVGFYLWRKSMKRSDT